MANANQGIKKAARIGWEQKLLKLSGADKFNIGSVKPGDDKKFKGFTLEQYEEVLKLHGFNVQYVYVGTSRYLNFVKGDGHGSATTRTGGHSSGGTSHQKHRGATAAR